MKKFTFIFMAILLLCIGAFAQEKGRPLTDSGYDPLGASKVNGSLTTQIPNNGNGAVAFDTYFMNAGAGTVYNTTDGTTNTRACDDKIVGTATTATYQIPMNTYYRYSYVQQIY
ncbi:MAG: hypothetical protein FWF70_02850, partial [Bacteroidetes bacterium]|nr:hypothetical protein [Bacteroidota bacterium]